jgi:hypothetical protein
MRYSDAWKQSGSISLWRYAERDRNYPGWHFSADRAGSDSFVALLDLLVADGPDAHRSIALSAPPLYALPGKYKSGGWESTPKLRLSVAASPAEWPFVTGSEAAQLSVGVDWVPLLRKGALGIHHGENDYSIGPRGRGTEPLWFW